MIVDPSAIIAILAEEPEETAFLTAMLAAPCVSISAGSWVELGMVMARRFRTMPVDLPEQLRDRIGMSIEPVTPDQARRACAAYRRYGIGSRSKAQLNVGDCFSYALATDTGRPLLFKGDDFIHTDIVPALR